ncbi:cysteine desulfurase family protein [Cohnella laeviribosi]|uniref:cysteine desulfurase family protein n=1 Tax=Cohnella laeviribosi TaxID=380174 RepID=UPI001FE1929B|nr:cysteine desulfurase family protein [Cohnella laeviribosi]
MAAVQQTAELNKIYLDYNASTPIAPEVLQEMQPYFQEFSGNPSSDHWAAHSVKEAIDLARSRVASLLGCYPDEVIFTSGGSESNNHALKGVYYALRERGNHIITTMVEHPSVLNPCAFLERVGAEVTYVKVDARGRVSPDDIEQAINDRTILISVMHANNEVGTIQPIEEISEIAKKHHIVFHTDAAQSVGKIPVKVYKLGVDLLSIAGHKLYAPKGIGALFVRKKTPFEPYIHGGGQEFGMRAGTENVPYIVALGKAAELASQYPDSKKIRELRDYFWERLFSCYGNNIQLNGHPENGLPNTLNVSFIGMDGSEILKLLPEIAASTGSACHSGKTTISPVLRAMKISERIGRGAIRFSLGRYTTKQEIDQAMALLEERIKFSD